MAGRPRLSSALCVRCDLSGCAPCTAISSLRPEVARAGMPRRQTQQVDDARCVNGVSDPARQAACYALQFEEPSGTLRQRVLVDVIDLAVVRGDARKQVGELLGNGWVEVGQFCR